MFYYRPYIFDLTHRRLIVNKFLFEKFKSSKTTGTSSMSLKFRIRYLTKFLGSKLYNTKSIHSQKHSKLVYNQIKKSKINTTDLSVSEF